MAFATTCLPAGRDREVAGEEAGVDGTRLDPAWRAEPDQRPVVTGFAAPPRFPAVDNLAAVPVLAWLEGGGFRVGEIFLVAESLIARGHRGRAQPSECDSARRADPGRPRALPR